MSNHVISMFLKEKSRVELQAYQDMLEYLQINVPGLCTECSLKLSILIENSLDELKLSKSFRIHKRLLKGI